MVPHASTPLDAECPGGAVLTPTPPSLPPPIQMLNALVEQYQLPPEAADAAKAK